ncbi:ABC transporter permease [Butyrivibrio sp. NC2002]|uniref:ABC transporter permease n=1 Tax=Butyrivibrio sp. NC2002 TaxID=1410610 RepID=UPI00056325AD|nr:ABC transporter permease subunit [Butyrivibrio sp. NC2002]
MKILKKIGIVLFWLIIWQIIAIIIHNDILFAGPFQTITSLVKMSKDTIFFDSVLSSYLHIMAGILAGVLGGTLLGSLSYKYKILDEFLSPIVLMIKAVPVASFVVLVLIWIGNSNLSTVISALVVFPIVYTSVLTGLRSRATKLIEMAYVYRMPMFNQIRYIYIPLVLPVFKNAIALSVGMGFKSGVAAEVIGQPISSMGNGLYNAKIYLDTGELFAWTAVIVLVSWITEKVITLLLNVFCGKGAVNDN